MAVPNSAYPNRTSMVSGVFTIPLPTHARRAGASRTRAAGFAQVNSPPGSSDFLAGPENALVRAATEAIVDRRASFSPLLLYGPSGSGKTHLALGLASAWKQQNPTGSLLLTDGKELGRELVIATHSRGLPDFRRRMAALQLIVIDDLERFPKTRSGRAELLRLLDSSHRSRQQLLVTLRELPSGRPGKTAAVASRLLAGLAIPLQLPELDARTALVSRFAARLGTVLNPAQSRAVAESFPLAPPQLAAVVQQLVKDATRTAKPIDNQLIAACRRRWRSTPVPSLPDVTSAVAAQFGLTAADLRGKSRKQAVARARAMAMYLARRLTSTTITEIGRHFRRDHTTVIHACRVSQQRIQADAAVRQVADSLTRRLTAF